MNGTECDYCGQPGCHWRNHDQAITDVIVWEKQREAMDNE